ncbi:MAG: class I SAM-dependent methyltransferase, partial [Magnetococcales bacterium]|nr:class I SAM-dependent methyltransferase [Magnetococcales bacterium]
MNFTSYPLLNKIITTQLEVFPQHYNYLEKRFRNETPQMLELLEELAAKILMISGDNLRSCCEEYKILCDILLDEEIQFRRTKRYRVTTIKEVQELVYSNNSQMQTHLRGRLLSHLWWANHFNTFHFFKEVFLPSFKSDFDLLEVGPGHGMFLSYAVSHKHCKNATAWDISKTSIAETKSTLKSLGVKQPIDFQLRDMIIKPKGKFDMIILSEVLEHLEEPHKALVALHGCLRPGGRLFLNVPTNSPTPDHIYLFRHPDEIIQVAQNAGFKIEDKRFFAVSNSSL